MEFDARRASGAEQCFSSKDEDGRYRHAYGLRVDDVHHVVCHTFWTDVYQVSCNFLTRALTTDRCAADVGRQRDDPKTQSVQRWMENMQLLHEFQPDTVGAGRASAAVKPGAKTGVLLPFAHRKDVYSEYVKQMHEDIASHPRTAEARDLLADGTGYIASHSHFRNIWKRDFKHVKLRKHSRFAKCDDCVRLRERLRAPTAVNREKDAGHARASVEFQRHLEDMKRERLYYHEKRRTARESSRDVLSIILDGADQGSYGQTSNIQ